MIFYPDKTIPPPRKFDIVHKNMELKKLEKVIAEQATPLTSKKIWDNHLKTKHLTSFFVLALSFLSCDQLKYKGRRGWHRQEQTG